MSVNRHSVINLCFQQLHLSSSFRFFNQHKALTQVEVLQDENYNPN